MTGLNVVAVDVNTVSPPQDVTGMTAFLAAAARAAAGSGGRSV